MLKVIKYFSLIVFLTMTYKLHFMFWSNLGIPVVELTLLAWKYLCLWLLSIIVLIKVYNAEEKIVQQEVKNI